MLVYRLLERKFDYRFICSQIIDTLKGMDFLEIEGDIPVYTRTDVTDALHEACGFRTDYEIVTNHKMCSIIAASKREKG